MKKTIIDKIKLIESAITVADFWEVTPSELVGFVGSFVKPEKKEEWNKIANEVEDFYKWRDELRKIMFNDRTQLAETSFDKPYTGEY